MKSFILLENMIFYAHHGVFHQETVVGNTYIVNLKMGLDLEQASLSDDLSDTISYADVYDYVKEEMMIPSRLLEHVAGRILTRLKKEFKQIESIEVKLSKRNPPIEGQLDCASVVLID